MMIRTQCTKCGVTIRLDFGELTRDQAMARIQEMDTTPRECPGQHVELGGWRALWNLDDAIYRAYDLGEGELSVPVMSDQEYVEELLAEGRDIVDGGANNVPELNLPSIHDFRGLAHMGFGNFKSDTHLFLRRDSPKGSRFYDRVDASA